MAFYQWIPNILCEIRDGKAYLSQENGKNMQCSGECHACLAFRGVDLWDKGKRICRAYCIVAGYALKASLSDYEFTAESADSSSPRTR